MIIIKKRFHYNSKDYPTKCDNCGSRNMDEIPTETLEGVVAESKIVCDLCESVIGYYAYGYCDPAYSHAYGFKEIFRYVIRSILK